MLASGEWWRLITPIFMHFSLLHILFNLLWVWIVGVRVEPAQGSLPLLGLVLFSGVLSNLAQFVVSGPMFGGMSGVVFALLGYAWLWDKLAMKPRIGLPPALMGFMLFWLVLGFTGVLEGVGFGAIANTAHLVGLLAGLIWLLLMRFSGRRSN
jgi:GlpG protein